MNTLEDLRAIALGRGSKATKVEELRKLGMTKRDAENLIEYCVFEARMKARVEAMSRPKPQRLDTTFSYGVEIECYNIDRSTIIDALRERGITCTSESYNHATRPHYKCVSDASIRGDKGVEIVTPVLRNFDSLKTLCEVLQANGAKVNKSCGLHVHIGAERFHVEVIKNLIKNFYKLQKTIFSFLPNSRRGNPYCKPFNRTMVANLLRCNTIEEMIRTIEDDRYYALNLCAYSRHKTIEFRLHSGTVEFEKINNWIQFLTGLIFYSMTNVIDDGNDFECFENVGGLYVFKIDSLPFLSDELKAYFKTRQQKFN